MLPTVIWYEPQYSSSTHDNDHITQTMKLIFVKYMDNAIKQLSPMTDKQPTITRTYVISIKTTQNITYSIGNPTHQSTTYKHPNTTKQYVDT